jgi:hypothetical protein
METRGRLIITKQRHLIATRKSKDLSEAKKLLALFERSQASLKISGEQIWTWSRALPDVPQPSQHRGRAASLEAAKVNFRKAWEDLQSRIGHGEIEKARAIAADRSRPWHKGKISGQA